MNRKKLTVHDYLACKGKRQLSVMFVHNADEAAAAEEAGIDMICTSHDAPQYGVFNSFEELKRIREAAPTCFMQSGGAVRVASEYEAMKLSHKYLDVGADVVYGGNWSYKWIRALRDFKTYDNLIKKLIKIDEEIENITEYSNKVNQIVQRDIDLNNNKIKDLDFKLLNKKYKYNSIIPEENGIKNRLYQQKFLIKDIEFIKSLIPLPSPSPDTPLVDQSSLLPV